MQFWPINGKGIARKTVHDCIACFRQKPTGVDQLMGNLPSERVTPRASFLNSGVDFCGPFQIKFKFREKGYFQKFILRFCMVGYKGYSFREAIQWKFIPPRFPNFGGFWEAGVKSFKHHLHRTLVNSKITFDEFETIIQIEGILNSRPLVPLSDNINKYEVLLPGHFIIGRPISAIQEPAILDISDNRLSRWQYTTKCVQTIWKRWKKDYLNHLQQRNKWQFEKNNVAVGCLVLLKENDLPPLQMGNGKNLGGYLWN
ncbi:integrase catalytic domain-containing protein [Trichonephila clavipes]|nr:integrase catalytic domain-containing protein [Trichonephila clavipes]